jgi:hypothetical protein
VRIDEAKLGHCALEGERVARIIGGGAVMSKHWNRNNQESKSSYNCEQFCFHRDPSCGRILPPWFYGVNVSRTMEPEDQFQIFRCTREILSGANGSHDTEISVQNTGSSQCLGPVSFAYLFSIFLY